MYLDNTQKQIIIGSLLGDGSLTKLGKAKNSQYVENHSIAQMEYLLWKKLMVFDLFGAKMKFYRDKRGYLKI